MRINQVVLYVLLLLLSEGWRLAFQLIPRVPHRAAADRVQFAPTGRTYQLLPVNHRGLLL